MTRKPKVTEQCLFDNGFEYVSFGDKYVLKEIEYRIDPFGANRLEAPFECEMETIEELEEVIEMIC